jgi:RNA polymerase sigma-70 factor, ECF subfamily
MRGALLVAEEVGRTTEKDEALAGLAAKDPGGDAFRALHDRHSAEVFRFLVRLVGEQSLAEDLLQETFFRVYQHLDRYDPKRPFRPWLFRIARNAALNVLRQRRKGGPKLDVTAVDPSISDRISKTVAGAEAQQATARALSTLPDDVRALLVQRHGLGMKLQELAESWDVTERTIRNRLHAAVAELTQSLLREFQGGAQ